MATKRKRHWSDVLARLDACDGGLLFASRRKSLATAWANCREPSNMQWLVDVAEEHLSASKQTAGPAAWSAWVGLRLEPAAACRAIRKAVKCPTLRALRLSALHYEKGPAQ